MSERMLADEGERIKARDEHADRLGWVIVDEAGNFWSGPNRDMFSAPPSEAIVLTCKEDAEKIRTHMLKRSYELHVRVFHKTELCDGPKPIGKIRGC